MKKISILLMIAMLVSLFGLGASAEGTYSQSPMLDARVEAGDLPPVEERLPENPRVNTTDYAEDELEMEIGNYGGTMRFVFNAVNWNPDIFVGMTENLLTMQGINSNVIEPNLVESYEVSDDLTTYTFTLRKGLKWSSGVEVTMDDVKFAVENVIFNAELTPAISTWMTVQGEPFEFTVIDELTFQLKFAGAYGGFPMYLTSSGWTGYTPFLKPAYYLKPFHKDFAEECHGSLEAYYEYIQPFGTIMGYDDVTEDGVWVYVYNQIEATEWECTDPNDCLATEYFPGLITENMPQLYPWIMVSHVNGVTTWERNPYYHKVDADGNQLPYIDYLTNTQAEDGEMVQMACIAGQADLLRESATVDNISLYRENAEAAGIESVMLLQGVTPTDLFLNMNYGLNVDGTVKDDDASKAWQEVITDQRFRTAIITAIDAEEMLDTLYNGLGTVSAQSGCTGDVDAANELLDEMGMVDIDGDGYRETPSGLPFSFQLWNAADATDIVPATELYVEFLAAIGINAQGYTTESSLMGTSESANEVPARVFWSGHSIIWYYDNTFDMGIWAPMYSKWYSQGMPMDNPEVMVPTDPEVVAFFEKINTMIEYPIDEIVNVIRPEILAEMDADGFCIRPLQDCMGVVVLNSDIRNVATGCITHAVNYFMEDMYFENVD